jgi:hypothetical protein
MQEGFILVCALAAFLKNKRHPETLRDDAYRIGGFCEPLPEN